MGRKEMTGRTFQAGLFSITAATVLSCLLFSVGQSATASPDPGAAATSSVPTKGLGFSTWVPRKGKMSYEEDAAQDEYGEGRNKIRKITCKGLPGFVGPGGGAVDEDIVVVTSKGTCKLSGMLVAKAVTIISAKEVDATRTGLAGMRFSTLADKYEQRFDCSDMTSACITTNVGIGKTVVIKGFHIFTDKPMMAPLVESRSGGLVLINNLIMGAVGRDEDGQILFYEQPAVIIAHGSHLSLKNNVIARASVGVMIIPTQITPKSQYALSGNILSQLLVGVQASGTTFISNEGPMAKINLENNYIHPALRFNFDSATYNRPAFDDDNFDDQGLDDTGTPSLPDDDLILGLDVVPPQYGVFGVGVTLNLRGNSFGSAEYHVQLQSTTAFIEQNIFRGADRFAINPMDRNQISISRNLFDSNSQIIYEIGYAFESRSPFPAGNVCVNQDFRSFHRNASNLTGYISDTDQGLRFAFQADEIVKISRSDLRRSKRADPEMWAEYTSANSLVKTKVSTNSFLAAAAASRKSSAKIPRDIWPVFRTFFQKQREPVVAHILFDRDDVVSPDSGLYRSCFDYSTLYKFETPEEPEDSPFLSSDD
jgi:hypothetical protein